MTTDQLTQDQIDEHARTHLATHPDATVAEVFEAIRASGFNGLLQTFQVHAAVVKVRPLPTLLTFTEALDFLRAAHDRHGDVGLFWCGNADITVIADGDGQAPLANVDPEVYRDLVQREFVGENSYVGAKNRRFHDYLPTVFVG